MSKELTEDEQSVLRTFRLAKVSAKKDARSGNPARRASGKHAVSVLVDRICAVYAQAEARW